MGILPATGTEIAMGKVFRAFGLSAGYPPAAGTGIGLNSTLGENREPPQATGLPAQEFPLLPGETTRLSEDFGGLTTPETYPE